MNSQVIVGGIAVIALVFSGIAFSNGGRDGKDGRDGVSVGAVSVLNSPAQIGTGGNLIAGGQTLGAGRRTLVDIPLPNATSTGTFYCSIQNRESYAVRFQMGWGSSVGATTTVLSDAMNVGAGEGLDLTASSSDFYAPNSHVVLNIYATTSAVDSGHNPTGGCTFLGSSY